MSSDVQKIRRLIEEINSIVQDELCAPKVADKLKKLLL